MSCVVPIYGFDVLLIRYYYECKKYYRRSEGPIKRVYGLCEDGVSETQTTKEKDLQKGVLGGTSG